MTRLLAALFAGTALLSAAPAFATTEEFDYSSNSSGQYILNGTEALYTGAGTSSFSAAKFDTTLGTLNSLTIVFNAALSATAKAQSGVAGDQVNNLIVSFPFTLMSGATGTTTNIQSFTQYADNPPGNGNPSAQGNGTGFSGTLTGSGTQSFGTNADAYGQSNVVAANALPFYQSNGPGGTITLSVKSGAITVNNGTSPDQNVFFGGSVTQEGEVSLIYNYTAAVVTPPTNPVPEPASMALLGAGLIGTGLIRRRSRK